MEYIYSAMVLHSAGQPITEAKITSILKAAGVSVDAARVKALLGSLSGVDIEDVIANAAAAPVAAAPAAAPGGAEEGAKPAEEEEEEEEEEEDEVSEEEAAAGLGALFG